jgi:hypothetical protein
MNTNETAGVKLVTEQEVRNWLVEQCERLAVTYPDAEIFSLSIRGGGPVSTRISCMDFRRPDGESLIAVEGVTLADAEELLKEELASPRKAYADKATKLREEAARLEKLAMEASA